MYIESIRLNNFRNYESLEMNFDQGTNILYGDNAQGKTNILEAVYLAGTSKSHKGSKDREMIRFENEESHIRMMVKKGDLSYKIDMHLRKNKAKGVAINGLPIRKARELLGVVNLVFFLRRILILSRMDREREDVFWIRSFVSWMVFISRSWPATITS
ncbi:Recombinational DNA repair ATPase (RecF pathway) [Ruminococcus sp. SR1/5]|nr:Recombinational DNA repair ATPase (RecF pathway) [Ruminococcus sp. SR1/5]